MKKYLDPDFIIPFLFFIILQPLIFFFSVAVLSWGVYNSIFG
jgi:hypothetical protein